MKMTICIVSIMYCNNLDVFPSVVLSSLSGKVQQLVEIEQRKYILMWLMMMEPLMPVGDGFVWTL